MGRKRKVAPVTVRKVGEPERVVRASEFGRLGTRPKDPVVREEERGARRQSAALDRAWEARAGE